MIARILAWLRRRPPAATTRDLGPYRTAPAPAPAALPSRRDRADEERVVRALVGDSALRRDVQDVLDALQAERERVAKVSRLLSRETPEPIRKMLVEDLRRERERS